MTPDSEATHNGGGMGDPELAGILSKVARRYPPPQLPALPLSEPPATVLAAVIEQARRALAEGRRPSTSMKQRFLDALAALIRAAMQPENGDPAIQAMVLRHHDAVVREYASLHAHAHSDRRRVRTLVNAIAHPARLRRERQTAASTGTGAEPEAGTGILAALYDHARAEAWEALASAGRAMLVDAAPPALGGASNQGATGAEAAPSSPLNNRLAHLLNSTALRRLRRLDALAAHDAVCRYRTLRDQMGPRARSDAASAGGSASHRRGAAVEAAAARALEALARRLNAAEDGGGPRYRVVTSMRAPATLPAHHSHAKTEWDAVLLRQAEDGTWEIGLLVEAKASVDAAATDLPRLLRGLRLLAQADENAVYTFQTREGAVALRGASLRRLPGSDADLAAAVLYCSNAPEQPAPRLLSAASRMQLLSAPASLAFASTLDADAHRETGQGPETPAHRETAGRLEPVWRDLLASQRWHAVLNQYSTLCTALGLMVHVRDLEAAAHRP